MAAPSSFVITGLGMRCAVGQNSVQACASVRAGIARFAEWEHHDASFGEEAAVIGAAVEPDLGNEPWIYKLRDLAWQPFCEAMWMARLADVNANPIPWGIYVAVPRDDRPGIDEEMLQDFRMEVEERELMPLVPDRLEVSPQEHAGGLMALDKAMKDLQSGDIMVAVVGGVDSLLHSDYLYWLFREKRLKTNLNPVGLIPGEAAAFFVLELQPSSQKRKVKPLARLTQVRSAHESTPVGEPCTGEQLTKVLREAIGDAGCEPSRIHRIITDLNGERWRFLEWSLAHARMPPTMPVNWDFWHPADCLGDVGAATAPALICLAARAFDRGYAPGAALPICVSAETGQRAASCVLSAESQ